MRLRAQLLDAFFNQLLRLLNGHRRDAVAEILRYEQLRAFADHPNSRHVEIWAEQVVAMRRGSHQSMMGPASVGGSSDVFPRPTEVKRRTRQDTLGEGGFTRKLVR